MAATRLRIDDIAWDRVEINKRFITGLFAGPAPDRPPGRRVAGPVDTARGVW